MENFATLVRKLNLFAAVRLVAILLAICLAEFWPSIALGYSKPLHVRIGEKSFNISKICEAQNGVCTKDNDFRKRYGISLNNSFKRDLTSYTNTPLEWVKRGAFDEDSGNVVSGEARFNNHFYNAVWNSRIDYPTADDETRQQGGGGGMHDNLDTFFGLYGRGKPSWFWGWNDPDNSLDRCDPNDPVGHDTSGDQKERFSWAAARCYWYKALVKPDKADRDIYVGRTFLSLGHIIHLLQDSGQPAHVRNDAHPGDFVNGIIGGNDYMESWTDENITESVINSFNVTAGINYEQLVADGQPVLRDFFDVAPVGGTFDGGKGIAEFTNHNFYSEDTVSPDLSLVVSDRKDWHQFKFPAVDPTSCGQEVRVSWPFGGGQSFIKKSFCSTTRYDDPLPIPGQATAGPVPIMRGRFFRSDQNGVTFLSFSDFKFNDPVVFDAYAKRLIPKTIAYSAGAIDFFFRGKFEVKATFQLQPGTTDGGDYDIQIRNVSGEPLRSGKITIYREDQNHVRHPMPGYTDIAINGTVADNALISELTTFVLPESMDASNGFMLVYRGRLGNEVSYEQMGNVGAVIGQRFHLLRVNNTWEPNATQDLYMRAPAPFETTIISWYHQDTDFGRRDPDYGGTFERGPDHITVKQLSVPGDYTFLINDYQDIWQERQYDPNTMQCVPASCPSEAQTPFPTGQAVRDYPSNPCYCNTRFHNTVRTYLNSFRPSRTQMRPDRDIFTRVPTLNNNDGGVPPSTRRTEGRIDDSWYVVQSICVANDGTISLTEVNGAPERQYRASDGKCCSTGGDCVPQ